MNSDAVKLKDTIQKMMDRFKSFQDDLKRFEVEQQKQRMINEHLLNQLISSKQKEQMFEKVMTLVLQFFQTKNEASQNNQKLA